VIVFRYISRTFVRSLAAALGGMTAIYLIIDYADRAKWYNGNGWLKAVIELYLCKLALVTYQLAPAGIALGAAIAMSSLRKTSEITAMRALGRGPITLLWPIGIVAVIVAGLLTFAEDRVVARANERAEEINHYVFNRWGDWTTYHHEKKWYRGTNNRIYYLGHFEGAGFREVTIYDLSPQFELLRRIDAEKIEPLPDGRWRFVNAVTRTFHGEESMREVREAEHFEQLPEDVQLFRVKTGRPAQQRRWELRSQIDVRRKLGLPYREWEVSYFERLAYQFAGIPAALIGASLALRRNRKGHLTAALAEGFGVTIGLWAASVFARTLALSEHISPFWGGFAPFALCAVVATIAVWRWAR
jgi:lipopolysaccharide export system permease protein